MLFLTNFETCIKSIKISMNWNVHVVYKIINWTLYHKLHIKGGNNFINNHYVHFLKLYIKYYAKIIVKIVEAHSGVNIDFINRKKNLYNYGKIISVFKPIKFTIPSRILLYIIVSNKQHKEIFNILLKLKQREHIRSRIIIHI